MIEKIDEKIAKELEKILAKEDLTTDEIETLISIKNDLKFEEKMRKMVEFAS